MTSNNKTQGDISSIETFPVIAEFLSARDLIKGGFVLTAEQDAATNTNTNEAPSYWKCHSCNEILKTPRPDTYLICEGGRCKNVPSKINVGSWCEPGKCNLRGPFGCNNGCRCDRDHDGGIKCTDENRRADCRGRCFPVDYDKKPEICLACEVTCSECMLPTCQSCLTVCSSWHCLDDKDMNQWCDKRFCGKCKLGQTKKCAWCKEVFCANHVTNCSGFDSDSSDSDSEERSADEQEGTGREVTELGHFWTAPRKGMCHNCTMYHYY